VGLPGVSESWRKAHGCGQKGNAEKKQREKKKKKGKKGGGNRRRHRGLITDVSFMITFTLCWLMTVDVTVLNLPAGIFLIFGKKIEVHHGWIAAGAEQLFPCMYWMTLTGLFGLYATVPHSHYLVR